MVESELLEVISQILNCIYMSDLKLISTPQLRMAIASIEFDTYTIAQWSYTLSYILCADIQISTEDDIKQVLQNSHRNESSACFGSIGR